MQIKGTLLLLLINFQGFKSQLSPPVFTVLPKEETTVALGDSVLLPCSATGNPTPKIVNWLINDKLVNLDVNTLRSNGDLQIGRTQKSDAGSYQCVARNDLGGVVSQKRQIIIAYFERVINPSIESVSKQNYEYFYGAVPNVDCQPKPKYIWRKNGAALAESSRISISNDGELFISNLDFSDSATYTISLENTFLQNQNVQFASQLVKTVALNIFGAATAKNTAEIVYVSKKQNAVEGETSSVTLECFINGLPLERVQLIWSKVNEDGTSKQVPTSSKYTLTDSGRRLTIKSPTYKDDNGKFKCSIFNNLNMLNEKEIFLDVYSIPEYLVRPLDVTAYTDNQTSLNCVGQGFPSINHTWYRNGIPISVVGKHVILPNNTLLLNKLNWEDNGLYQCAASNIKRIEFAQARVDVQNFSATIISSFNDIYIGFDTNIEIPCVVIGAPKPEIYWLINSSRINFPNSNYAFLPNGSLIINKLDSNGNVYTCVADNLAGSSRKSCRVIVMVPTRITEQPSLETYAIRGADVRLPCTVVHDPNINYTREWRSNNLIVKGSRYVVRDDGSLMITLAQDIDTGIIFSCHVFSLGGNLSVFTSLVLVNVPYMPSSPRVLETQPYFIKIAWDAPSDGGSPLTGYQLFMKNFTMDNFFLVAQPQATNTSFTVNGLLAGAKYRFKIAALNKFGKSQDSEPTNWIETQALAPSMAPDGFRVLSIGTDSVTLVWMIPPPTSHNGELLGFYIGYRLAGYGMDFTNIDVKGSTSITYTMSGLPLFTRYELKVAAYNRAGTGPWSAVLSVDTQQGIPSAPPTNVSVSVLTATSISVSFTSPPQQLWNGQLTVIYARTWPPGRPQDLQEYQTTYDPSSLYQQTFILPNLKPNTEYTLAVAVATSGGSSPGSSAVQFKTSEGVPDAVRDLMVSGIYSDAFTVSWKLPKESAGELKGYKIKYRMYGFGQWSEFDELPIALGAVVRPLLPRTRYEVSVAAFTSQGIGSFVSASVETIELPALPSAPSNLKAYGIWGNNISLGWTPGDSGRAVFLYYLIEYNNDTAYHINPSSPPVWRLIRNLTKILENPANIPGLKPSTTYRFRMQGFNIVGPSAYSDVSPDITTSEGVPSKPPTKVWASAPERQTLLIEWDPPEAESWNSGSIKYQFIIKPKFIEPEIQFPVIEYYDTQARSYIAKGLQKFLMYNITIRLFNDKGFGPWSTPVFFMTSEDYPAGAPGNVVAKAISSSTVQLTWEPVPLYQRNGNILGYKVFYMLKKQPETELFKDFPGNLTLSGTIDKLIGFVDYEFQLMAYTKVGGNFKGSPVTVRTLEGVPGKPRDVRFPVVTYNFAQLTWEEPLCPNGIILAYDVRYRQIKEDKWVVYKNDQQEAPRTARIAGLIYNSYYTFEIKARTAVGWGEPAVEKVLITAERFSPDSPVILYIPQSDVRTESVTVSWQPRFDGNSPIRTYNLQYMKDSGTWKTFQFGIPPTINLPASIFNVDVDKLTPASSYQFRVKAINDVGDSPWSDVSKQVNTPNPDTPGGPTKVRVIGKTPTSIDLIWEPPASSTLLQELRGYRVRYYEVGGVGEAKEIGVNSLQLYAKLSNLKVFQAYDVSIGAFTDRNSGIWTPVYQWRTGEAAPTEAPRNVKVSFQGASIIRVTWEPPEPDSIRGFLQGFKIESVRIDPKRRRRSVKQRIKRSLDAVCTDVPVVITHLVGAFSNEATIKNLRKYTNYALTVRVYNSFGDGPKSNSIQFTTPADVPGPPYLLSQRIYTSLVDVDFASPCEPNGRVLSYRVEYKEKYGLALPPIEYSKETRRIRISNLRSLTPYLLSLSAKTEVGYGQKATIEFYTKGSPSPPKAPDAPEVYKNEPGLLILKWQEGDSGNLPVDRFNLQYSLDNGEWTDFKQVTPDQLRYDGTAVVYSMIGLKQEKIYRFRVQSTTSLGTSPFSDPSKPITIVKSLGGNKPFYKEIWFIFVIVIFVLLVIILITICCCFCRKNRKKYKTSKSGQKMSSFEMSLVQDESNQRLLNTPSTLVPSKKSDTMRSSMNSIAKSVHKSQDSDSDSQQPLQSPHPDTSIANHYSNDPNHKNWSDSMDKMTKKQILSEFNNRPKENASKGKNRRGSEEVLNRPRGRPGRPDLTEQKKLARSEPMLAEENNPIYQPDTARTRRPAKKPFEPELSRSQPDIHGNPRSPENPITRQSSFLRATLGGSDDKESFQDVFEREKTKRELAMELDSKLDSSYPSNAPPPYDFNSAPPAYTPSQVDEDEFASEMGYPVKPPVLPKPFRWSDRSSSSNHTLSSNVNTPPYNGPSRGYPENYQPSQKNSQVNPDRGYPLNDKHNDTRFSPEPRFSPASRSYSSGNSMPQNRFNNELPEDEMDGVSPDTTLV